MKKVLLSLTAAAAFVFAAGTANAQTINGPITGKTQVVQANANLQNEISVTIPSPGADGGAVRFGTVPRNASINMDPLGRVSTNLGFSSSPAFVTITASNDEPLVIEFPENITLQRGSFSDFITYRPQISAGFGNQLSAANRDASKLVVNTLGSVNEPTGDGGTGEGPRAIIRPASASPSTSFGANPVAGTVRLFIGGKLYDAPSSGSFTTTNIAISKNVGTYTGEFTLNILYLN